MAGLSGLTADTASNYVFDAGAVYVDYGEVGQRLLGATQGGATFNIVRDIKEIQVDGAPGPVKGLRREVTFVATLKVKLLEMTVDNLLLALAGFTEATPNGDTDIPILAGDISDTSYLTNVTLLANISGSSRRCQLSIKNALITSDFDFVTADKEETTLEVTFTAHFSFDQTATDGSLAKPVEIIWPAIA